MLEPLPAFDLQESRRVEELVQRIADAEDCVGDKAAAEETENVPMTGVAGGDPRALAPRHRTDEREQVLRQSEDARPAVLDPRQRAEQLDEKGIQRTLDLVGRDLFVC